MALGSDCSHQGRVVLGSGEGLREHCIPGIFSAKEGMQGIYPHPKYRDMGLSCPGSFPGTYFCSPWEALEAVMLLAHPPARCPSPLPVTLPGVPDIIIIDLMLISLFIQEIKHVFDGEGQCTPTVSCAKDGLKQVIYKFLQGTLGRRERKGQLSNTLGQQKGESLTNGQPPRQFHFYSYT